MARHRDGRAGTGGGNAAPSRKRGFAQPGKADVASRRPVNIDLIGERRDGRWSRLPMAAVFDAHVSAPMLRVLAALACYADANMVAFPSVSTVAARLGCTRRHVQKTLRELEAIGFVATLPRQRKGGGWTSNGYRILYPEYSLRTVETDANPQFASPPATDETDTNRCEPLVRQGSELPVRNGCEPAVRNILTSPPEEAFVSKPSVETGSTPLQKKDDVGEIVSYTREGWPVYRVGQFDLHYYEMIGERLRAAGKAEVAFGIGDDAGTYGEDVANERAYQIAFRHNWPLPARRDWR